MPEKATKELPIRQEAAEPLNEAYESGALTEMLEWWRERKGKAPELFGQRPLIQGSKKKKNTGICVDAEVLELALTKAQAEKAQTGGSLSQLVELLLWQYIGAPEELVKQ